MKYLKRYINFIFIKRYDFCKVPYNKNKCMAYLALITSYHTKVRSDGYYWEQSTHLSKYIFWELSFFCIRLLNSALPRMQLSEDSSVADSLAKNARGAQMPADL